MIIIEQIKGLTAKPNAPEFKPSSEQPIAHIPDYNFMINAAYFKENKVLDQVNGVDLVNASASGATEVDNIIQIGNNRFFSTPMAEAKFFRFNPQKKLNGTALTVVFVAKPDEATSATGLGTIVAGNDAVDDYSVKVSFNATRSQLQFFGAGGLSNAVNPKISYVLQPENRQKPSLYVVTFSIEKGYEIRVNGKQVAINTLDKEARTSQLGVNEWSVLRNFSGQCGFIAVLDSDLTLERNRKFLFEIENHFKKRFSLD
ncbi:hypothetical protein [Acinetobacter rudis]|uniref:hypothetical protein n=1 Tax=Acinetobacter rudis TaxID=632955 RepID=UPI0033417B81